MSAVSATSPELARQSLGLDELYDKLRKCLFDNLLLATFSVSEVKPKEAAVFVAIKWTFTFGDGKFAESQAAVVLDGELSNKALITAQKISLLQVFFLEEPNPPVTKPETTPNVNNPVDNVTAINNQLNNVGLPGVKTADQLENKKGPTKKQLAEASQKLLEWKGGIDQLNPENPGDWDEHAQKLKDLPGLDKDTQRELFNGMKEIAASKGVGYERGSKAFYLLETTHS